MTIQIGENPWILISLTFLEILFIIIPPYIASKIEKTKFKDQLIIIGFHKLRSLKSEKILEIVSGIGLGVLFWVLAPYLNHFFYFLSQKLFGNEFVQQAEQGTISTLPINPSYIQLTIAIIQQIFIISICEEAFFRSFLIKKLRNKFKNFSCILLSSLCFALYHVPPFLVPSNTLITYFGYYYTFGVLLSLIFIFYKDSLLPAIITHGFFNIIIIIFNIVN